MSNATLSARELYSRVAASGEAIKNDAHAEVPVMSPGDTIRQGDVFITMLAREPKTTGVYAGRQLAPGTNQGSRHVIEGDCELFVVDAADAEAALCEVLPKARGKQHFFGPLIRAHGPCPVRHPEHGDRTPPAGTFLVTYEKVYAEVVRAVQD